MVLSVLYLLKGIVTFKVFNYSVDQGCIDHVKFDPPVIGLLVITQLANYITYIYGYGMPSQVVAYLWLFTDSVLGIIKDCTLWMARTPN